MQQFAQEYQVLLPPLRTLQTGSGRLSYIVSGSGPSTILLFSGAGMSLQGWATLWPEIERMGTVFGWNRLGMQGSDPPRERQTGAVALGALRELIAHVELEPPYVLVGHSLGGLFANLFARLYPEEVAGVLLLEATHPADHEVLQKHEGELARALSKVLALPQVFFKPNLHTELACVEETVHEVEAAGPFPPVPLRVVTGGLTPKGWLMSPAAVAAKRANQTDLVRLSPLGEQVIAQKSGHFPQLTQADLVLRVLAELVAIS